MPTDRPRRWIPSLVALCLATSGVAAARADGPTTLPAKQFAHPDRIRYDGHCLTIDGHDTFIYSGTFHYFRVPKELWRDRFRAIKAAHFNAVETYVPWNWHEREMPAGLDDASKIDLADLKDWLRMAHDEFGLYTILRPGPYICAEWAGGGFPQWLWSKQPADLAGHAWVRSDDAAFLAWSKHWLDAVTPVVAAEQLTRKPVGGHGVILFQIENEYDYQGSVPPAGRLNQLHFLYRNAIANGIDVPIFTCWTREARGSHDAQLAQVFDAPNLYSRWNLASAAKEVRSVRAAQPNAPAMVAELQGGWFADAGGKLSEDQDGVDAAQCNAITFAAMAQGGTILNYYMLVGGSNFGAWGGANTLQTYDYFAPIREAGGVTEKYAAVQTIGAFLAANGPSLARSDLVPSDVSGASDVDVVVRRAANGDRFVFCRNARSQPQDVRLEVRVDGEPAALTIARTLPPRIALVLCLPAGKTGSADGTWWGEPTALPPRPSVPASVRVVDAWSRDDAAPADVRPIAPDTSLIAAGVYDIGDVLYRSRPTLTREQVASLAICRVADDEPARLALRVNGRIVLPRRAGKDVDFKVDGLLREGANALELLYENHGVPGFGDAMNAAPGVRGLSLLPASAVGRPLDQWRVAIVADRRARAEVATDFDDSAWASFTLDEKSLAELAAAKQPGHPPLGHPAIAILNGHDRTTAVYRTTIDLTDADLAAKPLCVEFDSIDDEGDVFVNGQHVGRSTDYRTPLVVDVTTAVHAGRNVIAVVVTNVDGDGGLTRPASLAKAQAGLQLDCEVGTRWAGDAGAWQDATSVDGWRPLALDATTPLPVKGPLVGAAPPAPVTLRKWVRAEFALPAAEPNKWVPWGAVVHASGDGFVYLNGHALGRYYDVGPQRRFYLPEPWLKRGPNETNVLTLALHPVGGEPTLNGLELVPYADQAEVR